MTNTTISYKASNGIKINRARLQAVCGNYPRTWQAVIEKIPSSVIASINSASLAALADAMWAQYQAGASAATMDG